MFCGAGSFGHDDDDFPRSPSTPRGPRRRHGGGNPYSSRGLEEFSMVLADLETRREKIMATAGSQGVECVRFVYSNTKDWIPIIVRRREGRQAEALEPVVEGGGSESRKRPGAREEHRASPPGLAQKTEKNKMKVTSVREGEIGCRGGWRLQLRRWRDSYYWPTVVVLILLSLALFGRVFAICCISVWWYLVPIATAGEGGRGGRKPDVKKDYTRRPSDRRLGANAGGEAAAAGKRGAGGVDGQASPRGLHAAVKDR